MFIKYVFGRDWPSKSAGASFTIFSSYGIAKADKENDVEILMRNKTRNSSYEEILIKEFDLKNLKNYKVKFLDKNIVFIDKTTSFYIQAYKYLSRCAKKNELDVIITRKVGFLPYLILLKKKYNIKVYFEAHDYYIKTEKKRKKYLKKKIFQRIFLPKINGIISHLQTMINLYKDFIPQQNYLLARTGIHKLYKENKNHKVIAYIGSLDTRKNIEDIFKAMNLINDQNIKFILIGGKSQKEIDKFINLAKTYNLESQIEITGWVKRKKIDQLLKNVKVGLVPLENNFFNHYLTSPMKIFNYFSHGIPVIGTDLPTLREIISDNRGFLYENDNYEDLAKKITLLLNDDKLYEKFQKNIYDFADEILWDKRGKKILDFIEYS